MSSTNATEDRWGLWNWQLSLAGRLTAWYTFSTFALVLTITLFSYAELSAIFDREADAFLSDNSDILVEHLNNDPVGILEIKKEIEFGRPVHQYDRVFARLLDSDGHVLAETAGIPKELAPNVFPPPVKYDINEDPKGEDVLTLPGHPYRVASVWVQMGKTRGDTRVLQTACDRKREARILQSYRMNLYIFLSIALIACAAIGYVVARNGTRPVYQIAKTADRVHSTTLHERIETRGLPSELTSLASTFNKMLDRLEDSFRRLSQFSADIAHELRTPVNNMRGEVEVALGKARTPDEYCDTLSSTLEECERLAVMIDKMLFIARSESPNARLDTEPLDVANELTAVSEFYEAAANEAGVQIGVDLESGVIAAVNRVLFRGMIGNLVSNALSHTPAGGRVTIEAKSQDSGVCVAVTDTGCGIPPEHLPHIFDRFYRVDDSRSSPRGGVGLGLAIVRSIVQMHNAKIDVSSTVGKGTRIVVVLPKNQAIADELTLPVTAQEAELVLKEPT